jgi:protein involved in polysaccharide export with SLBB domain
MTRAAIPDDRRMRLPRRLRGIRLLVAAAAIPALAVACSAAKNGMTVDDLQKEPPRPPEPYRIAAGDDLEIRFFHTPELNATLPVRPDGKISLPYAQTVQAEGRTPEELSQDLARDYGKVLRDPEIAVIVRTFSTQQIHVGGRVEKGGLFPLKRPMTVLQSIFEAGGYKPEARLSQVLVIRKEPDGTPRVIVVNINRALNGSDPKQNIALQPCDVVYVPDVPIARVNEFVDLYIRKNLPTDFGFRFNFP